MLNKLSLLIALIVSLSVPPSNALAQRQDEVYRYVNQSNIQQRQVGESSFEYDIRQDVPPSTALRIDVQERPIESVEVRLRQEPSDRDAYVKVGFQLNRAFEGDRRTYIGPGDLRTEIWSVDERFAKNRPLLLAAYDGRVYVDSIIVHYGTQRTDSGRTYHRGMYGPESYRDEERMRDEETTRRCRQSTIDRPQFRLENREQLQSLLSGLLTGQTTITGELSGRCIREAGYYEQNRLVQRIEFPYNDVYTQRRFSLQLSQSTGGELRARTADGREEIVPLQQTIPFGR